MERISARLAALGRGTGALRLSLGEGLMRLDEAGGVKALGFPNTESYCREVLGRTGRWGTDVRALARRLALLPHLREALVCGRLSSSMVELVARVANPLDDAEWVERAALMTVREMRAELMRRRLETIDDQPSERTSIAMTVSRDEAWAFERARVMVEAVSGLTGDAAVEAMLAEGLTEILARVPDFDLPWNMTPQAWDETHRGRAELRAQREQAEADAEAATSIPKHRATPVPRDVAWPEGVAAIDARLRLVAAELASRDVEMAMLGRQADEHAIWWHFGFASFDHYCRDWIGLSPSAMASRVALAGRMSGLSGIADAVVAGRIGYESAATLARIAGPATVDRWIERAESRTVKALRDEVAAVETLARAEGRSVTSMSPPDRETLDAVHDLERSVIESLTSSGETSGRTVGQMSGGSEPVDLPPTALRLSLSEDVGRFWRALEAVHTRLAKGSESFVAFLVRCVAQSWSGAIAGDVAYAPIYLRDRWRCASPVCRRRNVTPHHVRFRSHGGSDGPDNVIALCEVCHLELVHGGRLQVMGIAPGGLRWKALGWAA